MTDVEALLAQTLGDDRRALPVASDALDRVHRSERRLVARRRLTAAGTAGTVAALLGAGALALGKPATEDSLLPGRTASASAHPSLIASAVAAPSVVAAPLPQAEPSPRPEPTDTGVPGHVTGRVVDERGRPLEGMRIMSGDLQSLLGRTDADGAFSVSCATGLVFAAYAFGPQVWRNSEVRPIESSPGMGNHAFRDRPPGECGGRISVVLPAGGVVEGTADAEPGRQVHLSRVTQQGDYADGTGRFGRFFTTVRPDGTYRIEGLATGRYSIDSSYDGFPDQAAFVDVREGSTTDGSYTMYIDPAACGDPWSDPACGGSPDETPSPEASPDATS